MDNNAPEQPQTRPLSSLRAGGPAEANLPMIAPGFGSLQGFELMVRQARALSASTLVPAQYQAVIVKRDRDGNMKGQPIENANAIPNCMIALNMATRMNADPLMVMQNLVVVEGRPSWSSQWVIAQINQCGRFEPLMFDMVEKGTEEVEHEWTEWDNNAPQGQQRKRKKGKVPIDNIECTAWTVRKGTKIPANVNSIAEAKAAGLTIIKGPKVSIAIAVKEGWYSKTGSKWQTMPELMLHYRSGAFFGRLHAPELLMGIPSEDEVRDMGTLVQAADGSFTPAPAAEGAADPMNPSIDSLRRSAAAHADAGDEQEHGPTDVNAKPAENQQTSEKPASDEKPAAAKPEPEQKPAAGQADGNLFTNAE